MYAFDTVGFFRPIGNSTKGTIMARLPRFFAPGIPLHVIPNEAITAKSSLAKSKITKSI